MHEPEFICQLIASRHIPDAYILGHVALASDDVDIYDSSTPHCEKCLTQNHKGGSITYMQNVLAPKVLCTNGMDLSLMSEAVENNKTACMTSRIRARKTSRLVPTVPTTLEKGGLNTTLQFSVVVV